MAKVLCKWKEGEVVTTLLENPEAKGKGDTEDEALGNLVRLHQDKIKEFPLELVWTNN